MFTLLDNIYSSGWLIFVILFFLKSPIIRKCLQRWTFEHFIWFWSTLRFVLWTTGAYMLPMCDHTHIQEKRIFSDESNRRTSLHSTPANVFCNCSYWTSWGLAFVTRGHSWPKGWVWQWDLLCCSLFSPTVWDQLPPLMVWSCILNRWPGRKHEGLVQRIRHPWHSLSPMSDQFQGRQEIPYRMLYGCSTSTKLGREGVKSLFMAEHPKSNPYMEKEKWQGGDDRGGCSLTWLGSGEWGLPVEQTPALKWVEATQNPSWQPWWERKRRLRKATLEGTHSLWENGDWK